MTPLELEKLGRDIDSRYVSPMSVKERDGTVRPLRNVEMAALLSLTRDDRHLDRTAYRWKTLFSLWVAQGCPLAPPTPSEA